LEEFDQIIAELVLVPSTGGVFEVEVDDHLVYSKKPTGRHADHDEILASVRTLASASS